MLAKMKTTLGDPILVRDLTYLTARAILVGIAFYFSAKLGLALAFQPDYVAVFWPPNTIILTALVLTSPRQWWAYLLAMGPAYFLAAFDAGYSEQRAVIFFIANVLEVLIAATALSRILRKPPEFALLTEVGIFIVFVVMLAPLVSASVASIATFSEPVPYWLTWRVWFLGDSLAHLALTPVLLTWILSRKDWFRDVSTARYAETGVLAVSLLAVSAYAFGGDIGSYGNLPALVYMPLPLLLWAAIRFGPRASCSAVFVVTVLAIWNAVNGRGPFTALDPAGNVLSIQLFLMVISTPMMFLAAFIQEHKQAASALRASEERLALSAEGTSDGLWDWDIRSDEVYFSPRWAEILGYRQDELAPVVATFNNLLHPDDRDHVLEDIQAHLDQRTPFQNIEFRIRGKDGDYIWVRSRSRAVRGEDGQAIRMAGSITDITEQKNAEAEVARQRAQTDQYLNIAAHMMLALDSRGRITLMNRAGGVLIECDEKQVLGLDWFDNFIPADQREKVRAEYDRMMNGEAEPLGEFENDIITAKGNAKLVRWLNSVIRDDDGNIIGTLSSAEDITERKQAEEALKLREQELTETQRLSHVGSWEWDVADGTVIWTEESYRIWGVDPEEFELTFENITASIPPDEAELIAKVTQHAVETGKSYEVEHRVIRPDGSVRHVLESGEVSVWDENGQPARVRGSMHDITELKLAEEQLRQAQKMEAVGQLTGGVAHEFNNLLMVIFGNIEALESRLEKDDPLHSFLSTAMKGAMRGAELTQSLLAFSRKQRLEAGETDLGELVSGMQTLFQRTLGETILIETNLAEGLWSTSADVGQIEAALLNFVLNARDAMPDGGTITLRTSNRVMTTDTAAHHDCVGPGDYVMLEVRDSGAGMTEEQIEHAFEPFYTTKEVGKGTGLGLSVAYGFAKQSGGCLEIESEPGQGTTVRLSLPRAVEKKTGTEVERSATEPASGSGKILIVEDDADVRALAVSQLSDLGYEIIEAEDGPSALKLLDENPDVDLLFSDVVLPGGMSGPEAAKQAHQEHNHLKVLFTSGYPEKDIEDMTVAGKDVAVLHKPYLKAGLAEAIAAAMKST